MLLLLSNTMTRGAMGEPSKVMLRRRVDGAGAGLILGWSARDFVKNCEGGSVRMSFGI